MTGETIEGDLWFGGIYGESGEQVAHLAKIRLPDGREFMGEGESRGAALTAAMQQAYPDKQIKWTPQASMSPHLVSPTG